jgi:hypothetical protein
MLLERERRGVGESLSLSPLSLFLSAKSRVLSCYIYMYMYSMDFQGGLAELSLGFCVGEDCCLRKCLSIQRFLSFFFFGFVIYRLFGIL